METHKVFISTFKPDFFLLKNAANIKKNAAASKKQLLSNRGNVDHF